MPTPAPLPALIACPDLWRVTMQALRADFSAAAAANPRLQHLVAEGPRFGAGLPERWRAIIEGYCPKKHRFDTGRNAFYQSRWYELENRKAAAFLYGPNDELKTFERLAASAWTALPEAIANLALAPCPDPKGWPSLYVDLPDKKAPPYARSERWCWFVYWLLCQHPGSYVAAIDDPADAPVLIRRLTVDPFTASRDAIDILLSADNNAGWPTGAYVMASSTLPESFRVQHGFLVADLLAAFAAAGDWRNDTEARAAAMTAYLAYRDEQHQLARRHGLRVPLSDTQETELDPPEAREIGAPFRAGVPYLIDAIVTPELVMAHWFVKLQGEPFTYERLRRYLCAEHGMTQAAVMHMGFPEITNILKAAADGQTGADNKTDKPKKKRQRFPRNGDVATLARRIRNEKASERTKTEIALELTEGNETRAQTLLRGLRRYKNLTD